MEIRWTVAAKLPGSEQACAAARDLLRVFVASWDRQDLLEAASLVLNELVANAVRHGADGGPVSIALDGDGGGPLHMSVSDPSSDLPVLSRRAVDTEGRRGLLIIDSLSARWGVEPHQGRGKAVWAEIR